ncbi:hypothetical protein [Rhizobium phage RHph_X2_26]|nr:hypothetical protein [Rhizobium phage RHph_X2_26]
MNMHPKPMTRHTQPVKPVSAEVFEDARHGITPVKVRFHHGDGKTQMLCLSIKEARALAAELLRAVKESGQ